MAFTALLALGAAIVLYETRGFTFYFDDWDFVLHRPGLSATALLAPHGPHLVLVPIVVYKILLSVFGGSSFLPFRLLAALSLVATALVLGIVCRRVWGRWWGLAPVLLLVTLGSGAWTLLWSFQIGYAVANSAGLLALFVLSLDRRHANAIGCGLLILSLASGSQGIGYLVGAAVILLLGKDWRRRAWVVLVPAVLYGLWYVKYGQQGSETSLSMWRGTLPYGATIFSSTISGLLGLGSPSSDLPPQLDPSFGEPIALAAIAGLGFAMWRGWRPPRLFWGVAAALATLWVATSLTIGRKPTDSRYLSTNAVLLLVCLCLTLPRPALRRGAVATAIFALVVISATNFGQFGAMRNQMLTTDKQNRAQLTSMLIMRGLLSPAFTPAAPFSTGLANDVQAGPFYSFYDRHRLPVYSISGLQAQDEGTREVADQTLALGEELGYEFVPVGRLSAGGAPAIISGQATRRGSCLVLNGGYVGIRATPGTYVFTAPRTGTLTTSAGRFATTYDMPFGVVPAGRSAVVRIPRDRAQQIPWRFLIAGHGHVCA
jgi:hypothetical protein